MENDSAYETVNSKSAKSVTTRGSRHLVGIIIRTFLCLVVLAVGGAIAYVIVITGQRPQMKPPVISTPIVQTQRVQRSQEQVIIQAMGTVIPARQMVLKARVAGEIEWMNPEFAEGGFLKKGEKVLEIDSEDYQLAIVQSRSEVANARYALKVELGYQAVAKREWELLNGEGKGNEQDAELALRKPHLEKAKADMSAADAGLKEARLNLSRTVIKAPFNAIVRSKNVDIGSQVSTQDQIAELIGTDAFWVQASVPIDRLKWFTIPQRAGEAGSKVRVLFGTGSGNEKHYDGEVIKLLSDLETQGRMAQVLVEVKDPLDLKKYNTGRLPLLIGEFVRLEIQGKTLRDVVRIPRTALRDDSQVWVAGEGGTLQFRTVNILWRAEKSVFIGDGIKNDDDVVVSNLQSPVEGMQIRIQGEASSARSEVGTPNAFSLGPPSEGARSEVGFMGMFDKNKDGRVSKNEFKGPAMMFNTFDKDHDGFITEEEVLKGPLPGGAPQGRFPPG